MNRDPCVDTLNTPVLFVIPVRPCSQLRHRDGRTSVVNPGVSNRGIYLRRACRHPSFTSRPSSFPASTHRLRNPILHQELHR